MSLYWPRPYPELIRPVSLVKHHFLFIVSLKMLSSLAERDGLGIYSFIRINNSGAYMIA